jgi:DNA-binding response OmpR family regulator
MTVVLLSSDLTVVSRVEGAALGAGKKVRAVSNAAQAVEAIKAENAGLVIVDLAAPALDIAALIEQLRSGDAAATRVVAFGPHVHEARLAAALEAGCDEVVSRGQFFSQLDRILGQ